LNLVAHILTLLKENEHVIIPGFGGFVARYQAAHIHPVHQMISPPNRKLAFNPLLNHRDGLLISRLMEHDGLNYEQSEIAIQTFAARCRQTLDNKDILMLSGIGKLFFDMEQNIQFVQDNTVNILPESYALPQLELTPRKKEDAHREVLRSMQDAGREISGQTIKNRQRLIRFAAFIALISAFATFAFFDHDIKTTTANFFEYLKGPDTIHYNDLTLNQESVIAYKVTETRSFAHPDFDLIRSRIPAESDLKVNPVINDNSGAIPNGYFVVVGSFGKRFNAKKLQKKLSADFVTYIIPASNGFQRVGIYISAGESAAMHELPDIRSKVNADAWILKR